MGYKTFQRSIVFHEESSHLIFTPNEITGFSMICNAGLKWVNLSERGVAFLYPLKNSLSFQGVNKSKAGL